MNIIILLSDLNNLQYAQILYVLEEISTIKGVMQIFFVALNTKYLINCMILSVSSFKKIFFLKKKSSVVESNV